MRYICGETVGGGGHLIGRLRIWRRGGIVRSSEEAILCLLCERDVSEALEYFALGGRAVGLLVFDAAPNRLASLCLPCLVIREELSPCALDGHIALIDLERSRLLLDPGLEALSEYARRDEDGHSGSRARLGRLCSAHELSLGGDIFEGALGFLESDTERGLCVSLDLMHTDRERLRGESEALFLAAVYGEISIMLSGFGSAGELSGASALLHSVFCELESEGREVNGCMARGVLVDSPIWLWQRARLGRCDFICFDFDLLSYRLLGLRGDAALGRGQTDTLCRFWEDCRASVFASERAELRALSRSQSLRELFLDWVDFMNISEIYLPSKKKT